RVATAKRPHRWRALLSLRASYRHGPDGGGVTITLADGAELDARDPKTAERISALLGREVTLEFVRPQGLELERANPDEVAARGVAAETEMAVIPLGMAAPEGGFFDYAPIHFIATSSLEKVASVAAAGVAEPVRFRPNLVIDTPGQAPFLENDWVGGTLEIGAAVLLEVLLPTPRCAIPTLAHGSTPPDPQLTRKIGTLNKVPVLDMGALACLGAYARVVRAGSVAVGDPVIWRAGG
ncbi:MAG TPA: MOSC domain-containing protein, partial [Bryobacteraceae bacterium]|nr:MOSC domain-containing protein [Bryobacteraceae bacterium]